jgi:hypothetical protein
MSELAQFSTGHPAPQRDRVSLFALCFGLAAAPLAWVAQTIIGYALSSYACFPGDSPRSMPLFAGAEQIAVAMNLIAIVVAAVAASIACRSWQATRDEDDGRASHLVEVGEGRTRFLALWGMLTSVGFLVAMIFASLAILLVPLCGR